MSQYATDMPFSRTNSDKSGEMKPAKPPLLKRHTLKSAFGRVTTTIHRIKSTTNSNRNSNESKSTAPTSNPCMAPGRRTQISISKPCTRASMKADLSKMTDGTYDAPSKRSNHWYNLQRRLEGECNHKFGTCDWKNIPVFSDGDSVDESRQAIDLKQYWRSNPLRKRSTSFPNLKVVERQLSAKRAMTHGTVEDLRKTKADWKQIAREPR